MGLLKKAKTNFNVLKITLVNIRITFSPTDYRKWAKTSLQQNFNFTDWDLKTIFHLFPFIFGFFQLIASRYKDQTFSYFFEKTIPGNQLLKEETSWETFEYIKSKNINVNQIKKIHLYNNSFIIEFEQNSDKYSIGFFQNKENTKKLKINSTNYKLIFTDLISFCQKTTKSKKDFLNDIYYNLDELPLKVEEIITIDQTSHLYSKKNIEKVSIKKSFFDFELDKLKNKKPIFPIKKQNQKNIQPVLLPKIFQRDKIFIKNVTFAIQSDKNEFNKSFLENENYSDLKTIIQNELDSLFYINNLRPFINSKKEIRFSKNFTSNQYLSKETLKLLTDYLPIRKDPFLITRKISGYYYPDLSVNDIYSLFFNFLSKSSQNQIGLKINLPASFIYSVENKNSFSYFLSNNLNITNRRDNFFGLTLDQESFEKKENLKVDSVKPTTKELKWKIVVLKEVLKKENVTFEDLNDFDPDSWFLVYKTKEKNKASNFEENEITNFLGQNFKNNFIFSNNLFIKNKTKEKLVYHYNPFTENLLINNSQTTSHFGQIYKRIPSFSNFLNKTNSPFQKNNFNFYQSWEPISIHSWMIIMEFSVGLFLLQLLKDLYKDYGKELVDYVLQFASSSGIDVEEIKEQYLYDDPGYRLIKKVKKTFKDIAGIDNILPELGEIVWFLRNSGRSSKFQNSIPKGILLTGPPGTGKTLLVQAIAGEAQVPIIVESGSLLSDPQQKGRGIEKLKKIFDQARQLAPCIVFIDEVDTIGEKRQNIIQTAMGGDELIESLYENKIREDENTFIPQPLNLDEDSNPEKDLEYELFRGELDKQSNIGLGQFQKNIEAKKTRLNLLTQFLVEMDGLKQRQGVIVIGATNRPTVLDPALIRPGRFDQILNLELPGKNKRIEILKLYSKKLQIDKKVSWEYLANRTQGFSAADLAAAMNESAIQSILNKTKHTIETIERGIDLVTSYSNDEKFFINKKENHNDPFFISRLAYYQAGKVVLQTSLPNHNSVVVLHLWPRQKNARHARFSEKSFIGNKTRSELEVELIGLYAGKAAEMITFYGSKNFNIVKRWQSDLGIEDLLSATCLANLMVDKWFFYSNRILTRKFHNLLNNRNNQEFQELEKLELLTMLDNQVEDEIEIEQIAKLFRTTGYQQRGFGAWWQIQVSKQTAEIESFFADWYRIYLPDPEESLLNLEWIPPDEYYHTNQSLKKISPNSDPSFNDLYKIERDYIYHGLILNSFNKAFSNLENMREFLDYFADYLIRYDLVREDQIFYVLKNIKLKNLIKEKSVSKTTILTNNWGENSRRPNFRFVNLETLKFIKNETEYESPFLKFQKD